MPIFTNKATLSYNGRTVDSNTVTGTYTEALTVSKNALTDTYGQSSTLIYVVSLVNLGGSSVSGVTVTDDLGAYAFGTETVYPLAYVNGSIAYYVNGVLQGDPTVTSTQPLVISGLSIPAGGSALLIYEARVTEFAPLDTDATIVNIATVSGDFSETLTASETVTAESGPMLTITKGLTPTTVPENGALTYTFTIQNFGNTAAVATDNLVVTDLFDPILTITGVTLNGQALSEPTDYTYNATTGEFATVQSVITVPAASYTQNADGSYTVIPGETVLTVSGTI